jgi:phospholipase/lecithinase/hemolysin
MLRLILTSLIALWLATSAWAEPIQSIVVFGDSLSDTGNVYASSGGTIPSAPYYEGRYSNGPVWVEHLAQQLGVAAPTAALNGGTNYAFGGAETGSGMSMLGTPNLGTQVGMYLGSTTPAASTLHVVWGGNNDFLAAISTGTVPNPAAMVSNIAASLTALIAAGAQQFLVANLPPLGSTPLLGPSAGLNAGVELFNQLLAAQLAELRAQYGVSIALFDMYGLTQQVLANPGAFGFTNTTGYGMFAEDPNHYLFWDGLHPTAAGHELIGLAAAKVVPEPTSAVLLVVGGGLLLTRRKLNARR